MVVVNAREKLGNHLVSFGLGKAHAICPLFDFSVLAADRIPNSNENVERAQARSCAFAIEI